MHIPDINKTVLMSGVDYFTTSAAINPFMDSTAHVSRQKGQAEHDSIRYSLEKAGIRVIRVAPPPDCQDGVYTANWALVRGNKAVLSSLPNARQNEQAYAEKILTELGKKVYHVPDGLRYSGQGDSLPCGNYLFCGSQYRSDPDAQAFAAQTLGYIRIQLQTVPLLDEHDAPVVNEASGWPDSFFYDIDLALSVLRFPTTEKKGLIAWCPEAFMPESRDLLCAFDGVEKIEVSIAVKLDA